MTQIAQILTALPQLKISELSQIKLRLDLLLKTPTTHLEHSDWLLVGITDELKRRGLWSGTSIPKSMLPVGYSANSLMAQTYLLKGLGKTNPRAAEKAALARLAAAAIIDRLTRIKIPTTPKTVLASLSAIGMAMDDSYPGYWGAAAFGLCLQLD